MTIGVGFNPVMSYPWLKREGLAVYVSRLGLTQAKPTLTIYR